MSVVEQFLEFMEQVPNETVEAVSEGVLLRCRQLTRAEAGSVFILRHKGRTHWLEGVAVQNDVIPTHSNRFVVPADPRSIAGYVATTGQTLYIDDAYEIPADRPYRFNRGFDDANQYRTHSILCFALRGFEGRVVGVVQLINRRPAPGAPADPFLPDHEQMIAPVNHLVGRVLERADALEQIEISNRKLQQRNKKLKEQREKISQLQAETEQAFLLSVELLARAAELHDTDTGNHILRVNEYSYLLANLAGQTKKFCEDIRVFASLHDVGKMSVDKAVLHKKGALSEEEFAHIQKHTVLGYQILAKSPRLAMGAAIANAHHEKWDGTGYPNRLRGAAIPLPARIVAIADIYDALRSPRPYKPGFSHEEAVRIMTQGDARINPARHFDPKLLALFAENHLKFAEIWDQLTEHPPPAPAA